MLASTLVLAGLIAVVLRRGVDEAALAAVLRLTARTSLALFLAAFSASSLHALFPTRATAWLLAHRRYFGISFAFSHILHGLAIVAQALETGGRSLQGRGAELVGGGLVYALILFMLATSFDRTAALVGRRLWSVVHTTGAYAVWGSFTGGVLAKAAHSPPHLGLAVLLLLALGLRLARRVRARRALPRPHRRL